MASWIVHLRAAEGLLAVLPWLDAHAFAVGNIAPDSGIPDEKWEHFTPPPEVTHFGLDRNGLKYCRDLDFYRQSIMPCLQEADQRKLSFLWGYFCHLVVDNLWLIRIGVPTKERWKAEFDTNSDFIWEVKKDWYGLDFEYVRMHPDSLFWKVFLDCEYKEQDLDFLPGENIRQNLKYIKDYYQRSDERVQTLVDHPRIYLTGEEMDRFVEEAVANLTFVVNRLICNEDVHEVATVFDMDGWVGP